MGKEELQENSIRVVLIDDNIDMQGIIASILKRTADIVLIGVGENGKDAFALCEQLRPDILLLDVMMPVMDGIEAAGLIRSRFPDIKILALSSAHDHESVQAMLQNGAHGYISKSGMPHSLAENIRATYCEARVFSAETFPQLILISNKSAGNDFGLTEREREVLVLMAAGLSKPKIAKKLNIGRATVKTHIEHVCKKLGVRTRSEALILAEKNHLV